jgi:protein-S-isoprenylcysteine O-methyltransferase Ste14
LAGPLTAWHAVIPTLWVAWLIYWIVSGWRTKTIAREESVASRMSHVVPLLLGGILLATPDMLGPLLEQRFHAYTFGWFLFSVALIAIGLGFSVLARVWLGGNWSSMVTLKQGHELIRSGPYALVRHPIYTGLLLAITGSAIAVGKWRALIALALFAAALVRKLTIEERFMAEQFGEAYERYREQVAALIPFVV